MSKCHNRTPSKDLSFLNNNNNNIFGNLNLNGNGDGVYNNQNFKHNLNYKESYRSLSPNSNEKNGKNGKSLFDESHNARKNDEDESEKKKGDKKKDAMFPFLYKLAIIVMGANLLWLASRFRNRYSLFNDDHDNHSHINDKNSIILKSEYKTSTMPNSHYELDNENELDNDNENVGGHDNGEDRDNTLQSQSQTQTKEQELNTIIASSPTTKSTTTTTTSTSMQSSSIISDGICQMMGSTTDSIQLWNQNIHQILNATLEHVPSAYSNDQELITQDEFHLFRIWVQQMMMQYMTPRRLLKSVKQLPTDDHVKRIIGILEKRKRWFDNQRQKRKMGKNQHMNQNENHKRKIEYEDDNENEDKHQKDEKEPPPLRILVMGGSVTKGHFCYDNPITKHVIDSTACNWSKRLGLIINQLLGFKAVQIFNYSAGGTSSNVGSLQYKFKILFPNNLLPQPDIVINAYSTNDMHVVSRERRPSNSSPDQSIKLGATSSFRVDGLEDKIHEINEDFIRSVLYTNPCQSPPLLIYLSDYFGNFIKDVKDTMIFNTVLDQLTSYYDVMYVSYADAMRDIVLRDDTEYWFSPKWILDDGNPTAQIHPGMGGHIAIMWVILFNFIHSMSNYCNLQNAAMPEITTEGALDSEQGNTQTNTSTTQRKFINTNQKEIAIAGKPHHHLYKPLPAISNGLLISDVTNYMKKNHNHNRNSASYYCTREERQIYSHPCIFGWMLGTKSIFKSLPAIMNDVTTHNNGWEVEGEDSGVKTPKRGWASVGGNGSKFTMEWHNISRPIHGIQFFVMHSYGEQWENSTVHAKISSWIKSDNGRKMKNVQEDNKSLLSSSSSSNSSNILEEINMVGYHDSQTSITYPYDVVLGNSKGIPIGASIKIEIELIKGTYFKFTGMALCSSEV